MIVTIAGMPGSGKSTAARNVAAKLGFAHHSVGDFMRSLAKQKGMSLLEIGRLAETDPSIDLELDGMQARIGVEKDNFVIDSRLGFHFIPHSFKVFLKVSHEEAARRIFRANREHELENMTLQQTVENVRKRIASEKKRYREYYGVDPFDESHYDLVIDTTHTRAAEVAEQIVASLKKKS